MRKLLISSLTFFLASGTALAATHLDPNQAQMDHGPAIMNVSSISGDAQGGGDTSMGGHMPVQQGTAGMSSTSPAHSGSDMKKPVMAMNGISGVVGSVSSASFTITLPASGDRASTTVTVTTSSNTKFMRGNTTAALSDVIVGSNVAVFGKITISTKTIAAERVLIAPAEFGKVPPGGYDTRQSILTRIKNILMGRRGSSSPEHMGSSSAAAAVEGSGFFGSMFHAFLNLF